MGRLLPALLGVALLLLAAPAVAADTSPGSLRIESADTSGHPEVQVDVVAPRALADEQLDGRDFSVIERGQPRDVDAARLPAGEQEIILAVDVSGSMRGAAMEAARDAAGEFVARVPDGARIGVVAFATHPQLLVPLTADKDGLAGQVAGLEAGGNTALYDAVVMAAELFADGSGRQALVLLSDGADTSSRHDLEQARDRIAAAGASFYAIELETAATDRAALERLVSGAGGMVVTASDPAGLAALYDALAVDLGNRYTLRYQSGAYERAELEVGVDAYGVHQRVGGYLLDLPEPPAWRRLLTSPLALAAGLVACYAALAFAVVGMLAPRAARLSPVRLDLTDGLPTSRMSGLTERVTRLIDLVATRKGWKDALAAAVERAGLNLRPADFVVLAGSAALAGAAAGLLLSGWLLASLLGAAVLAGAKVGVGVLARRRQATFADQLDESLQLLAGGLRAGHSLLQAVDAVSHEAESPTSEEFARVVNETRLGRDLGVALDQIAERMDSEDFLWVAQAIAIHREVGGDLAEVLDTVGHTIRERNQIRRQVKALSAEGKLSAIVLMGLPFGILAFLAVANPGYLAGFTASLLGYAMLAVAGMLLLAGGLWLRKLVRFQF